jgi:hypothetical protein
MNGVAAEGSAWRRRPDDPRHFNSLPAVSGAAIVELNIMTASTIK